eukprot:5037437-Amphidinium_carterae.1
MARPSVSMACRKKQSPQLQVHTPYKLSCPLASLTAFVIQVSCDRGYTYTVRPQQSARERCCLHELAFDF